MISLKEYIKFEIFNGNKYTLLEFIRAIKNNPQYEAIFLIRVFLILYNRKKFPRFNKIINKQLVKKFGIYISGTTKIGVGLKLPHPNGIIFGAGVEIGCNNIIYHQVTFGGANIGDSKHNKYPKTSSNCIFFAGSKVLGQILVEENTTLGANSVLLGNTVANSIYAGVPAVFKKFKEY